MTRSSTWSWDFSTIATGGPNREMALPCEFSRKRNDRRHGHAQARTWSPPRRNASNIVSNPNSGVLCPGPLGLTPVALTVGETGDGPSRVYDPTLGRFLQRDQLPTLEKIVNATRGNALGIYDRTIFSEEIRFQSKIHRAIPHLINVYTPFQMVNGYDASGFDGGGPLGDGSSLGTSSGSGGNQNGGTGSTSTSPALGVGLNIGYGTVPDPTDRTGPVYSITGMGYQFVQNKGDTIESLTIGNPLALISSAYYYGFTGKNPPPSVYQFTVKLDLKQEIKGPIFCELSGSGTFAHESKPNYGVAASIDFAFTPINASTTDRNGDPNPEFPNSYVDPIYYGTPYIGVGISLQTQGQSGLSFGGVGATLNYNVRIP
jgi:hypothetical protein